MNRRSTTFDNISLTFLFVFYQVFLEGLLLPKADTLANEFADAFFGYSRDPIRILGGVVYGVGLPYSIMALVAGIYAWFTEKKQVALFLTLGALIPLLALIVLSPFARVADRYVFLTLICWVVLGALGIKELLSQVSWLGRILAVGILVILLADPLSQNLLYYQYQNGNRHDWKGAFSLVKQQERQGDLIITSKPEVGNYYSDKEVLWAQEVKPDDITGGQKRAWFVLNERTRYFNPELLT